MWYKAHHLTDIHPHTVTTKSFASARDSDLDCVASEPHLAQKVLRFLVHTGGLAYNMEKSIKRIPADIKKICKIDNV